MEGETPRIAVVGPTQPKKHYDPTHGTNVGYRLREYLEGRSGLVGSVGQAGLALDVYKGVVQVCRERTPAEGGKPDDRFFLVTVAGRGSDGRQSLPEAFRSLATHTFGGPKVVAAGPREYRDRLADMADILVVVNGGSGALRQAQKVLMKEKPVVALESSGGAAQLLGAIQTSGQISRSLRKMLEDQGFELEKIPRSAVHAVEGEINLVDRIESLQ